MNRLSDEPLLVLLLPILICIPAIPVLVLLVEVVVFDKKLKSPTPVDDDVFNDARDCKRRLQGS